MAFIWCAHNCETLDALIDIDAINCTHRQFTAGRNAANGNATLRSYGFALTSTLR